METSTGTTITAAVPASFFGIVLGLSGLTGSWRAAHLAWGLPAGIGDVLQAVTFAAWFVITLLYALRWLVARDGLLGEAQHPVQCCFIGLAGVATMLVAQGALPHSRAAALCLFAIGAVFTLFFALWRTGILWRGEREPAATTPILYLPTVAGSFVTGIVSAAFGWTDWAKLAFGMGFFAWLAIESVLLHRLYTAATMPPALRPALGIQLAPPAVGASCYLAVNGGHPDLLAYMLVGYALLQALLLIRMAGWIGEQPFGPSYWSFTFGATALASATVKLSMQQPGGAFSILAPAVFVAANLLVLIIGARTLRLLLQGRLLPPVPAK